MITIPRTKPGFTIVELLIVIVVIAILAAIAIVAYSGIQERAHATATIATAKAYITGLKLWQVEEGVTPGPSSCIAPATYTTCDVVSWGAGNTRDTTFNDKLAKYSGISTPRLTKYGATSDVPKGLMFYHSSWYGGGRAIIGYRVGPNSDCGNIGPILASDHNNYAPAGQNYTSRTATVTVCEVEVFKF